MEELDDDLTRTLNMIADENGVIPIPEAHVTAIYGMNHLTEHEVRQRFRTMKSMAKFCESWPDDLRFIGVLMDIELAGVNGGLMVCFASPFRCFIQNLRYISCFLIYIGHGLG